MAVILQALRDLGPSIARNSKLPVSIKPYKVDLQPFDRNEIALRAAAFSKLSSRSLIDAKASTESSIRSLNSQLKEYKLKLKKIEDQIAGETDLEKAFKQKQKELNNIFAKLLIVHAEYKAPGTFIFTTDLLRRKEMILGQFRIWIDLANPYPGEAVRVINIYKVADTSKDHPCISGASLCQGTFADTLKEVVKNKNLFEIVESVVAFIVSPNVIHGYITSWAAWESRSQRVTAQTRNFDILGIAPRGSTTDKATVNAIYEQYKQLLKKGNK